MYEVRCCCSECDFARRLSSGFEVELLVVSVINGVGSAGVVVDKEGVGLYCCDATAML